MRVCIPGSYSSSETGELSKTVLTLCRKTSEEYEKMKLNENSLLRCKATFYLMKHHRFVRVDVRKMEGMSEAPGGGVNNPCLLERVLHIWRIRNFPMTIDLIALATSLSSVQRAIFTFRSERDMPGLLRHFLGTKQEPSKKHLETRKLENFFHLEKFQ